MPKPSLQRGSVTLSTCSEPGNITAQQPAPNRCRLPSRHLLPVRIARDIGRDLKQQLTYIPTQRRSRKAHTSAKVRREPLLQTRRRTDILRNPTTRPQVNPRLIRQIRAGQATCSTSRRRKEPTPILAQQAQRSRALSTKSPRPAHREWRPSRSHPRHRRCSNRFGHSCSSRRNSIVN